MSLESLCTACALCVVGNINRDVKTAPFMSSERLFADGETSVAAITETIGGGGANSVCAAAALGARTAFLGKVGADSLGTRLAQTLAEWGVAAHLAVDAAHPTGTSINLAYTGGQRHFVSALPNNMTLGIEDIVLAALDGYQHLLRADLWFSESMLHGGNALLLAEARTRGLLTSIDLNWDPCWGVAAESVVRERKAAVRRLLPLVTLAHGNVRELTAFAETDDLPTALQRLTAWGAEAVVVHLGAQGAGYYTAGTLITEPPAPIARQAQTTGTGDVLSVCMMLLHHYPEIPIRERLRLANAQVARFIEGDWQALPELG